MSVRAFIQPVDRRSLLQHLGVLLQLLAVLLLPPLVVALALLDAPRIAALLGAVVGAAAVGTLAARGEQRQLHRREALLTTALAYPLFSLVASVAFIGVLSPVDALFEAMSGFTTTGLTLMDEDTAPTSLLFLRAWSQFVGGLGIIVVSLLVLAEAGSAVSQLYASEASAQNLRGSVRSTARMVGVVYVTIALLAYGGLLAAGVGPFDGLLHAMATVSTGGFSPYAGSIGAYDSAAITAVTGVFMLAGAISLPLYWLAWRAGLRGGWRRAISDVQGRALLLVGGAGVLLFSAFGVSQGHGQGVLGAAFNAISAVTTTGFVVGDPDEWPDGTRASAMALMAIGGGVGSSAGGLKLLRLIIFVALVRWVLQRTMLPREAKVRLHVGDRALGADELQRAVTLVALYVLMLLGTTLALTALGHGLSDASFDAISALSTVGLSVGVVGPELPGWATLMLVVAMWAGRVEFLPVLLLLHPGNWRRSRGGS